MNRDVASERRKMRVRPGRGMYLLPSLFTAGNIGAGYFAIVQTIAAISGNAQMHLDWAAIAILFAIPFDALDGRIARMTNTCSDFGKELDSLADVITFGVAPSLLAFVWGFHFLPDSINPQLRQHLVQAGGFFCFPAMAGDPWLDSLRDKPAFTELMHQAETRHREAAGAFTELRGDRALGVALPS